MSSSDVKEVDLNSMSDVRRYLNTLNKTVTLENTNYKNAVKKLENFSSKQIEKSNLLDFLYPNTLDPEFNIKIANKKEFNDLTYDTDIKNVIEESDIMCNSQFELAPHQVFIHNFMSTLTPYNSLLLFHGLGTGKTCSAINVCENMRDYLKHMGINKKILIIASPNVQDNFKVQLFDDRKLKEINGLWNIKACTGNKFLNEINPMNMKGLKKEKVTKQIRNIIRSSYEFMGYTQFSNTINKIKNEYSDIEGLSEKDKREKIIQRIEEEYSNRLIVIDEVHNIRITGDSPNKDIGKNLLDVVMNSNSLKLLLLSATPMFNSYKEIIWLLNLMNANDRRPMIESSDIFYKNGKYKEYGRELLIEKMRGYISFVRGENPYTFPYRIYPNEFDSTISIKNHDFNYPRKQINNTIIDNGIRYIDLFMNKIGKYQQKIYDYAINNISKDFKDSPTGETDIDNGLGWQKVDIPLQLLNFTYPIIGGVERIIKKDEDDKGSINLHEFVGVKGLKSVMDMDAGKFRNLSYKDEILSKYGRIFSPEEIGKYSQKMKNMTNMIKKSEGIVLIYSQYIGGGCVPLALALEEMGIQRLNTDKNLLKDSQKIFYTDEERKNPAKYIMITGDKTLSPNNSKEIKEAVDESNKNGDNVKVVIISKAGSEGIDFKNIRQIHIIEPWYNMSRLEQIIGRGVRFCSHKQLPFKKRNVEIYLYGSDTETKYEAIDLYIYRMAERKAKQIGKITRLLKEYAIDCRINTGLNNLTVENINQSELIKLSSGAEIKYNIGDKPYTQICDYMDKCEYICKPETEKETKLDLNTYDKTFIRLNVEKIMQKIRDLYKREFVFSKREILMELQRLKKYPLIQINSALDNLVTNKTEYIYDMFNRTGNLINISDYYFFQPVEITNTRMSYKDRSVPIQYKRPTIKIALERKKEIETDIKDILENITNLYVAGANLTSDRQTMIRDGKKENIKLYIHTNLILRYINDNIRNIIDFKKNLKIIIIRMIYDRMIFKDKIKLLEYLLKKEYTETKMTFIENIIFNYINKISMLNKRDSEEDKVYIFVTNNDAFILYKFNETTEKIEKINYIENIKLYEKSFNSKKINKSELSEKIFGFISIKKKTENILTFKTKSIEETTTNKNTGNNCNQSRVPKIYEKIDELNIIDRDMVSDYNQQTNREFFCILLEVLLRYSDIYRKDGLRWFLSQIESKISKIIEMKK